MTLRKMSPLGDEVLATWDTTTSPADLEAIEKEFNRLVKAGYFAADISPDKEATIIHKFDAKADILLLPLMVGGA